MLSVVAGISLVYDLTAGVVLLAATDRMASWFGAPVPDPILFAKLNGLFLIAVGLGYLQPLRQPDAHRAYMWIFGVLLKGAGRRGLSSRTTIATARRRRSCSSR